MAASGEALGELVGYTAGYSGGFFLRDRKPFRLAQRWMQRWGGIALFLFTLVPNPVFDVLGVTAGGLRYSLVRFLAIIWVGALLKMLAVSYACIYGLDFVVDAVT